MFMILFPAIDIKDGNVIRLLKGEFDQVTTYGDSPVEAALQWQELGAKWLHVIDLDGAKTGEGSNRTIVKKIAQALHIPVQTGGGIRSEEVIRDLIDGGVSRVILGTKAVEDRTFLRSMIEHYGDKIAVSLDCHDGYVATKGWVETTEIRAIDFVQELEMMGLQCLIYTDIATDGMLTGPNLTQLEELLGATRIPVISSGGIKDLEHIRALKALEDKGVMGAITGKAIYEGTLDVKEALALC